MARPREPTRGCRIAEGPIPVDEAIAIARQIALALEAGHEAGVVHRDLKPANVRLKEDGTIKVLDYGLAKALEGGAPEGADSGLSKSVADQQERSHPVRADTKKRKNATQMLTMTRQGTLVGVILGTAAYMSPEQAKGKRVYKRADVWAFGALVYEMLTGKRAFDGEDVSDTLAAVLRAEPDFDALPANTPESLQKALHLCLTKDLKGRVRDIGDVALAIAGAFETRPTRNEEVARPPSRSAVIATSVLSAIVTGLVVWSVIRSDPIPRPVTRLSVTLAPDDCLAAWGRAVPERRGRTVAGIEKWRNPSCLVARRA